MELRVVHCGRCQSILEQDKDTKQWMVKADGKVRCPTGEAHLPRVETIEWPP